VASWQRLYRLAIWDADYLLSRGDAELASAPVRLIYAIAKKPESFHGSLPPAAFLSPPPPTTLLLEPPGNTGLGISQGLFPDPTTLGAAVTRAKVALGLTQRP
jgi:hypothetical protein